MFGKYITRPEKDAVHLVTREFFLQSVMNTACALSKSENKDQKIEGKQIDEWI